MNNVAKIYDATLSPGKADVAAQFSPITELIGSWRLVDPAGEVGIEVLVGRDDSGTLRQLPLTYRSADSALASQLTPMTHSVLGARSVAPAPSDPVAVTETIRAILTGVPGAEYSAGAPCLDTRGTGDTSVTLAEVALNGHGPYGGVGTLLIDGTEYGFELEFSQALNTQVAPEGPCMVGRSRELFGDGQAVLARLRLTK